jgi:tryptophan 2,3-dioxygenase
MTSDADPPPYRAAPLPPLDAAMDASKNHYWTYHALPTLLACKRPLTASQDEDLFIAVHQVCELAFHQMILDLGRALDAWRNALREAPDGVVGATHETQYFLRRVVQLWRTVNTTLPILNGLRAFAEFRTSIGPTSGFQSAQFRHLEIMSGVPRVYWAGGTADAEGRLHVAETEFDRVHGDQVRQWLDTHRDHSLRAHYLSLLSRAVPDDPAAGLARLRAHPHAAPLVDLLAQIDRAQTAFHRSHLNLASIQLRRVGADTGTGGTAYRDYLARYERELAPLFPGLEGLGTAGSTDDEPAA